MHLGSQHDQHDEIPLLDPPSAEARILAAAPQVRDCLVASARLPGRIQTDVLLDLKPGADPDDDWETPVRAALGASEAATLRRIFVIGRDRLLPPGALADDRALTRQRQAEEISGARLGGLGPAVDPVPQPTERVPVPFSGDGEGVAVLTWGQQEIWQSMTRQGNWLPLGGWRPLDPGTSVEDVAEELAYLHSRFPSMRTTLRIKAGERPLQQLAASGTTHLDVFDADGGPEAADELAATVSAHYRHLAYDLRTEWPVRMAVIRRNGEPTHMAVAMHHLALDGGGAEIMLRDVAVRATTPPTGLQQLDQAAWQTSPAGRRHSDRTLRHFADILRVMPTPTFPPSADPRRPRYWSAELVSPALRPALAMLAERTGADSARVLHAVYAIAVARVTGVHPVLFRPVIGNRFRHQLADVVCHAAQAGLVLLDVADSTVEEVIGRAGPAAMNALKHSYFDPWELIKMTEEIGRERGAELDIASFFNDRRATVSGASGSATPATADPAPAPATTAEELAAARTQTRFRWLDQRNDPVERLFLHIDDAPDSVTLTIEADTRALAPDQIEQIVRELEEVTVSAALQPGLSTRIKAD